MAMSRCLLLLLPSVASALDVVVVGAGVSGITAARTLMDNWATTGRSDPLNIFVLEASGRLGGRTFTDKNIAGWGTITGAEADKGASWIHGSNPKTHPVTQMANLLGLATLNTSNNAMKITRCNADASQCTFDTSDNFTMYKNYIKAAEAFASSQTSDMSMWDAMGNVSVTIRDDPAVQSAIGNTLEFEYGASPDTMSAKYYNDDEKMKGGGPEQLIVKGYTQIVEALQTGTLTMDAPCRPNKNPKFQLVTSNQQSVDVRYNKQVTDISLDPASNRLVVTTADATTYPADRVILTVPLGVLKKKTINFSPPLPAQKQTAINKLWFGDLIKVGMLFDTAWWNDAGNNTHYFGLAQDNAGGIAGLRSAENFTYFLNTQAAGSGRPVMFTFVFGSSAMEVESWTDDMVWAAIYKNLVATFKGADGVTVPSTKPQMWRSNWGTNPLFGGVYASNTVGVVPDDWKNMKAPLMVGAGAISFAGEHTNHDFRGTVHGAFWSGQRAACEALKPNGQSTISSTATFNTANPAAAMANPGFAAGVDSGAAAAAGVPASAVSVSFSLTPPSTPAAPSRRLSGNATNRTLIVTVSYSVLPSQAAAVKAAVANISKETLAAAIKQALNQTNSTDDDVDFEIDDVDDPTEEDEIEDSQDDVATTRTATTTGKNTMSTSKGLSSFAEFKHFGLIPFTLIAVLAFVSDV
jgi:monoamine oxidase